MAAGTTLSLAIHITQTAGTVGIMTGLRIGRAGVRHQAGTNGFSRLQNVQTGCGAHPATYLMCISGSFLG